MSLKSVCYENSVFFAFCGISIGLYDAYILPYVTDFLLVTCRYSEFYCLSSKATVCIS